MGGTLPERADESWNTLLYLITDPVAIDTGRNGQENGKESGASNQSRTWVDRWRGRKSDAEHVPPYSFTQRLRSTVCLHSCLASP